MSKRVLLLIPEGLEFSMLSSEQQAAISSVFGQYVMPMPFTVSYGGNQICDAITADNFDPLTMTDYGIDWPIIGMWSFNGDVLIPFNETDFLNFLPDGSILHEPHTWAGWPTVIGV